MARQKRLRTRTAWRPAAGGVPLPLGRRRPPLPTEEKEEARMRAPCLGGLPRELRPLVLSFLDTQGRRLLRWAEEGKGCLRVPTPEELARAEAETAEVEEEEALCATLDHLELGGNEPHSEPLFAAQTPREEVRRRKAARAERPEDPWRPGEPMSPGRSWGW